VTTSVCSRWRSPAARLEAEPGEEARLGVDRECLGDFREGQAVLDFHFNRVGFLAQPV
jgi:hypothetical protein